MAMRERGRGSRDKENAEIHGQPDLFYDDMVENILSIDEKVTLRIAKIRNNDEDRISSIRHVIDDIRNLVKRIEEIVYVFGFRQGDAYERLSAIAGKWASFAAYCGSPISLEGIADPRMTSAFQEIRDKHRPKIEGTVVKTAMQKTVTVLVERRVKDPRTGKRIRMSKKYLVHDEYGQCKVGDYVVALSCRRLSKKKSHSFVAKIRPTPLPSVLSGVPQDDIIPYRDKYKYVP